MALSVLELTLGSIKREFHFRQGTSDEGVIAQIFKNNDYNITRLPRGPALKKLYESQLRSGHTPLIVDAGANIGASAVHFGCSFPSARIVAIEPEKSNFELLLSNTKGLSVEYLLAALAANSGLVDLVDPGLGHWAFRTSSVPAEGRPVSQKVQCVTVNEIYQTHSERCAPFIVKIDIEGGEYDVFQGNTEWVEKTPLIIIELHDWLLLRKATSQPFLRCISSHDRDFLYLGENVFSIDNKLLD